MTRPFRRKSEWLLLAAASATISCGGQAKGKQMDHPLPVIDQMIERLRAARTLDVAVVERITGAALRGTDDSNASFAFYKGQGAKSGGYTLGVDLRLPVAGSDATGGALLALNLSGQCARRAEVEARYGPLTLAQVPRGRSADEKAYWSRREPWGDLSFGFSLVHDDCLSSVVFTLPGRG